MRTKRHIRRWAGIATIVACGALSSSTAAEPRTKVFINGKAMPVYFNDGDSFRVLTDGTKARLAGYNTLESHGAVHQWGTWTEKELFVLAKMATIHARDRVWHCESDGKTDTYGRTLMWCPDLAEELIRLGYAHAMSIDDTPARPELLAAQREAIAERRGMWAHGSS
jgi:endonuclease YncB( thermonuclease family)